jgi:O-antigen/teichoic acid export membrane protein
MIQVVEPEFRHDIESSVRAKRVWTDLLVLSAWLFVPSSALLGGVLPLAIPFLLGNQWSIGFNLLFPLALVGSIQIVVSLLGTAIQFIGKFRWILVSQTLVSIFQIFGLVLLIATKNFQVAVYWLLVPLVVQHSVQVGQATLAGYLAWRPLFLNYAAVSVVSFIFGFTFWGLNQSIFRNHGFSTTNILSLTFASIIILLASIFWKKLPFIRIAKKYNLFRLR